MKNLLLLFSFFLFIKVQAQLYKVPLEQRIKSSELIIEGRVINSYSYWDGEKKLIYTSNKIEVQSVLKGEATAKIIQIITFGGKVDDIILEAYHFLSLSKEESGIFFCTPTQRYVKDNRLKAYDVYAEEQGFLKYFEDGANAPIASHTEKYYSKEKEIFPIIEKIVKQKRTELVKNRTKVNLENWLLANKIFSPQNDESVFYNFDNPTITGNNFQYLEFDITAKATNLFKFEAAKLYIHYDTTAFGTNIVTNGNVAITKENIILSPDYQLAVSDSTNSLVRIDISSISTSGLYDIGTSGEKLCHVKLNISNVVGTLPQILFVQNLMQGNSTLYDSPNNEHFMPYVIATDTINQQWTLMLPPHISYIDPNKVSGGTGDFIAIHGNNFGNSAGRISFLDADLGNGIRTFAGSGDILLWIDSLILVNIYSTDTVFALAGNGKHHSAGSGYLWVEKAGVGGLKDSAYLEVIFSSMNYRYDAALNWREMPTRYADSSGFAFLPFQFNNSFSPAARRAFIKAYKEWQCNTNVAWGLDTVNITGVNIAVEYDGVSTIAFHSLPAGLAGSTVIWWKNCQNAATTIKYPHSIDMIFDTGVSWYIDSTNCIPIADTTHMDFWTVALHELGHAHLLGHVTDKYKVMYYKALHYPYDCKHTLDAADLAGGQYVTNISSADSIYCFTGNQSPMNLVYCSGTSAIFELKEKSDIIIYPKPASSVLYIKLKDEKAILSKIMIFDMLGNKLIDAFPPQMRDGIIEIPIENNFNSGIYIIHITTKDGVFTDKILINK
jgi:hypothetical protein